MDVESNYKLNDFLQKLSNGKKVFDFSKIDNAKFPIVFIVSERGSKGKTLNIKEQLRKEFIKTGKPSIWLFNTIPMVKKGKSDFLKDMNKPFVRNELKTDFWDNCKMTGDPDSNLAELKYKGNHFIKLLSMNHTELMKGSRIPYEYLIYDEFNVAFNRVIDPINKLDSLLHSLEDLVENYNKKQKLKFYIFGNNKSLNNPIIYSMGIDKLTNEITEYYDDNGKKLILVIAPQFTDKDKKIIESDNQNNWIFQLSKKMGTANHSYFNESLFDNINNIKIYTDSTENLNQLKYSFSIYHKKEYYNVYRLNSGYYHIIKCNKNEINILFTFQRNDVIEKGSYKQLYKKQMIKLLYMDYISFENITSRELFISSIK